MAVDIGAEAISRAGDWGPTYTVIVATNPAAVSGPVEQIDIYVVDDCTGVEVAIFTHLGGNNFTTRANASLGNLSAGLHAGVAVSMTAVIGDYIGFYVATATSGNTVGRSGVGGSGEWYHSGDHIPCVNLAFTANLGTRIHSLGGYITLSGWTGKIAGVTNPAKVMGVDVANIANIKGVA